MDSNSSTTQLADSHVKSLDEMQMSVNNALGALHLVIHAIEDRMQEVERDLKSRRESLDSRTQAYFAVREDMRRVISRRKNKVKFNVGGRIFAIEKQDIMRYEDSLFYYMLCTDTWTPDVDGKICRRYCTIFTHSMNRNVLFRFESATLPFAPGLHEGGNHNIPKNR